jgi:hypothetical protein
VSLFGDCTGRLRASAYEPEVWVVLGMAALGLPPLTRVVWPKYDLQPFVLLLRYESSGRRCSATAPARGVVRG